MSEVVIDVTLKIKTDKINVELTKDEAKQLRDALDKALKAEANVSEEMLLAFKDMFKVIEKKNPYPDLPFPNYPVLPQLPYPDWTHRPQFDPVYLIGKLC